MAQSSPHKRSSSYDFIPPYFSELRVVLLGSSWRPRSAVGNLLLKNDEFDLLNESKKSVQRGGPPPNNRLWVTNTPDLQADVPADRLTEFIRDMAAACAPGPHVFLLVLQPENFTKQQKNRLESVLQSFSEQAFNHSLVLISTSRAETPELMEEHMKDPNIKDLISKCNRSLRMNHREDDPNMEKREELLKTMGQMMEGLEQHLETGNIMADIYKEEMKTALQNNDQALAFRKAQTYLDELKNVHLNVAITGESGSGKSTLVNALRGIRNNTEGAAPTGVSVTTLTPTEYLHPEHPNIRLWDLPGVGTIKFPADKYLEYVEFEKYDFFIIVSNHRFRENDAKLAKEIHKMKKKFYFVRSKIDLSVQSEKANDTDYNKENLLKSIRENCTNELQKLGFESPKVFLVSGLRLHLCEFKDLWKTLEADLPKLQRDVRLRALPNISLDVIKQKKRSLESQINWYTAASAAGAAVPILGVSVVFDLFMITGFTLHCLKSLGLTPESLQRLSDVSGVPLEDLRAELKLPLSGAKMTTALIVKVLSSSATYMAATVLKEGVRFIPVVAMSISSATTYGVLTYILNTLAVDAQRVFMKALGLSTSV